MHVILITSSDRRVQDLLQTADVRVTSAPVEHLTALAAPSAKQPDIIVIDLRDASGVPASLAAVRRQHPHTGVVLIAPTLDPTLLLEAMRAGVNEVVTDPLTQADLERAISRVRSQRSAEAGSVFGFVGAKGGVGTTTIAVNTATGLGAIGKPGRTLLVDFHMTGGDDAVFLGVEPRFSILDALENTHRLDDSFLGSLVAQVAPHTDLLAASDRPFPAQVEPERVRSLIATVANSYKYTVVDLPRSDSIVLQVLDQLSNIFVVANQELATVKSASRLCSQLRARYGRDKVSVVLSRPDQHAEIGHADVERAVGSEVAHIFPSDYRLALQALNKGRPIALENHNDLSASFKRFAHAIAGVRPESKPQRSGLFGRLTHRGS